MDICSTDAVSKFIDGEMTGHEADAMRRHLAECDACLDFLLWCWALEDAAARARES